MYYHRTLENKEGYVWHFVKHVKMWRGKFSCPLCDKLEESEDWFMREHMVNEHSKEQLADCILDSLTREKMGDKVWSIEKIEEYDNLGK